MAADSPESKGFWLGMPSVNVMRQHSEEDIKKGQNNQRKKVSWVEPRSFGARVQSGKAPWQLFR